VNNFPAKHFEEKVNGSLRAKRPLRHYSGALFLIFALLLAMSGLLAMILLQWNTLNQKNRILPASLLAVSTADYSGAHQPTGQVGVVEMAIVGDMIRDLDGLQPGDMENRLASVTAMFLSPVPTATPLYPHTIVPGSTRLPTQENPPGPHATSTGDYHSTATVLPALPTSGTPLVSQTLPGPTATPNVPVPTRSPVPNPQPTYTTVPIPPTSQPPTAAPPPPPATDKPHPVHPTDKPKDPKPTKKPKK
jgi:hypothetical protein